MAHEIIKFGRILIFHCLWQCSNMQLCYIHSLQTYSDQTESMNPVTASISSIFWNNSSSLSLAPYFGQVHGHLIQFEEIVNSTHRIWSWAWSLFCNVLTVFAVDYPLGGIFYNWYYREENIQFAVWKIVSCYLKIQILLHKHENKIISFQVINNGCVFRNLLHIKMYKA